MNPEKRKIMNALWIPLIFIGILWVVKSIEYFGEFSFVTWGLYPKSLQGLKGVIFAPFIHSDFKHLFANSLPLVVLGGVLLAVYREIAWKVVGLGWLMTGIWVWFFARDAFHIGASGLVYMLGGFHIISGLLRREPRLMALSLMVIFLYGSMVWGVLPIKPGVSWESHLMGMLAGIVLAVFYRKDGPQRRQYSWELEPESDEDEPMEEPHEETPYYTQSHTQEPFK